MALNIGATFAGYRIIRLLGSGGMGEVYLAAHPRLPRRDALKILSPAISTDPDFRRRFHREADVAATLFHPHIVGVHDRGETDGQLWIALDFVDGADAGDLLRRRYPAGMPPADTVAVIRAVGAALDHAHARGLLHRDVKPANILLTDESPDSARRIMLADFGIARSLSDVSGLTATGMAVGTVDYAAPEQLTDAATDGRADQYSLAATAFHLLTGAAPYRHSSPAVTISRHLAAEVPRAGDIRPELAPFDEPLRTALAKDPADRFPSCRHFAEALATAAGLAGAGQDPAGQDPAGQAAAGQEAATAGAPTLFAPVRESAAPASAPVPQPPPAPRAAPPATSSALKVVAAATALGLLAGAVVLGVTHRGPTGAPPLAAPSTTSPATTIATTTVTVPAPAPTPATTTVRAAPRTTTVTVTPSPTPEPEPEPTPAPEPEPTPAPRTADDATVDPVPIPRPSQPFTSPAFSAGATPGPDLISFAGFDVCARRYAWSSCLQAARDAAGAPYTTSTPLTSDGVWMVPQTAGYGDYRAAVGRTGSCQWFGYDARGRLVKSGSFPSTGAPATATVTPTMATFRTVGCTPWFRVAPAN